ncbi:MAG: hypothetical protein H8E44_16615 [Planctomycetes bacterium]|nr:hypothetical protein [Planctomycetota bacterium]MBL7037189.1 hypothetical protein [Pirellulaceae bacterium]
MRSGLAFAMLIVSGLLNGCAYDEFLVEITPKGDSFERKLTCWHVGGATVAEEQPETQIAPLSRDKLDRLEQIYGDGRPTDGGRKHVFIGIFQEHTPADVGGSGTYTRYTSPLGNTVIYAERFRGDDDLAAELARRGAAADQLVDLLIGWFRSEIGETADFARLRDILDRDLRRDLKNVAIYVWTNDAVGRPKEIGEAEFAVRVWQYLRERGYVTAEGLPRLVRAISGAEEHPDLLLSIIRRGLARKMGVPEDEAVPECLAFLANADRVKTSFEAYVRSTDLYKRKLNHWEQDKSRAPDAKPPEPMDVVGGLVLGQLFPIHPFASPDRLEVRLACGTKPFRTNGKWDARVGVVTWEHELAPTGPLPALSYAKWSEPDAESQTAHFGRVILTGQKRGEYVIWHQGLSPIEAATWDASGDTQAGEVASEHVPAAGRSLPALSYAAWSEPDAESQTARFGRVILTGQELGEYVIWYQGLSPAEATAWDAFLAKCEPNERLRKRIEAFRFPSDPPLDPNKPDERPPSLTDTARELILKGLEADR